MRGSPERGSGGDSEDDIRGNAGRDSQGNLEGYSESYREGRSERNLYRYPGRYSRCHSDCNLQNNLQGNAEDYLGGDLPGGSGNCGQDCILSPLSRSPAVASGG